MIDRSAETARLMNVCEAIVDEFERQGVHNVLAELGFNPTPLAIAVIRAADGGDVLPFPGPRSQG
jgi:hypothetical protein